jgi:signal transduction histidine kinase
MRFSELPVRVRLVSGFAGAMLVVLTGTAAFVFWRVQISLDHRLNQDLTAQLTDLEAAAMRLPPHQALASLRDEARESQILTINGVVLASGPGIPAGTALLNPSQASRAGSRELSTGRGNVFSKRGEHLRIRAVPVHRQGRAAVAATAVRLGQRDEALRELFGQLAIGGFAALLIASAVGYRLARAALDPVERYRAEAEKVAKGATGVRLNVPAGQPDEVRRLGSTLNSMLEALDQASERQRQFIDNASHELRTPLAVLAAEIDLALRKQRSASEYEQTLHRVAEDTAGLLALSEALLTLGTLQETAPRTKTVQASDLLEAGARRASAQLDDLPDRPVFVIPADSICIRGDDALIQRAVGNLVDNAVRHGQGEITLSASLAEGCVVLTVHDEGRVPPDFLPKAAERFSRADQSRTGAGTGLGLALVDAIAAAHGGQLRVCSTGGHHFQHTPTTSIATLPCTHPVSGTAASILLPGGRSFPEGQLQSPDLIAARTGG